MIPVNGPKEIFDIGTIHSIDLGVATHFLSSNANTTISGFGRLWCIHTWRYISEVTS